MRTGFIIFNLYLACLGLCIQNADAGMGENASHTLHEKRENTDGEVDKYCQYIGYGYDVTSGPLYDTANVLHLNNPILDVDSSSLKKKIKQFTPSKVTYTSGSYNSKSEVAEHLGKEISGGNNTSASFRIGPVVSANVDISATFNTANTESWKSVQQETFSYHNIYAQNRTVTLQLDPDDNDFDSYLAPSFLKDAKKITTNQAAENFLAKYGTHLLMGYTLGGVFEMTNYYACNSSSYVKENTTSFDTQVAAGLSVVKTQGNSSTNFSFTQTYGLSDNNSYATNQYKLQTFGGKVFPGLTIDQAFSYFETAFGAGYMYSIWTDSINEGDNLVITNVPANTPLVPLYRVLPNTQEYVNAKELLLASYLKQCSNKLAKYRKNNKDVGITDMKDPGVGNDSDPSVKVYGYDRYSLMDEGAEGSGSGNTYYYSYAEKPTDDNSEFVIEAKPGDVIRLDYEALNLEGFELEWRIKEKKTEWYELDAKTGLVRLKERALESNGQKLHLVFSTIGNNPVEFANVSIRITDEVFNGGEGTEANPYLIANAKQFNKIGEKQEYWNKDKHFKLINDINLSGVSLNKIGTESYPFQGTIDGNYHSIKNLKINSFPVPENASMYIGFLSYLGEGGKVRNLTLNNCAIQIQSSFTESASKCYAGILVGKSYGEIDNCHIINSTIEIKSAKTNKPEEWQSLICIGGLVGQQGNKGFIKTSEVKNVQITTSTVNIQNSAVGGLIGSKESAPNEKIERCSVVKTNVSVTSEVNKGNVKGDGKTIIRNYIGGFVGDTMGQGATYSNCFLAETNVSLNDRTNMLDSNSRNPNSIEDYIGGFVGYYRFNTGTSVTPDLVGFENVFIDQTECPVILKYTNRTKDIALLGYGSFIGKIGSTEALNGHDVIVYNQTKTKVYEPGKADCIEKLSQAENGTRTFTFISGEVSLINSFSSDFWDSGKNDKRRLKYKTVVGSAIEFDFSNAPKTFKYGEEFTVGNGISIQKYYADGSDMEEDSDYYVDYSDYQKTVPGSYTIKVSAYGKTDSYVVQVGSPEVIALKVKNKPTQTFYAGDDFGFIPTLVAQTSNGSEVSVALNDPNLKVDSPKKLTVGQNKITYTYCGVSTYIVVNAVQRVVKNYTILNKNTLEAKKYAITDKNVDLSGMEISVEYENAPSRQVSYDENEDDFSVFHSKFQYGKNEVQISYKDYVMQKIVVDVRYAADFTSKVSEFKNIINRLVETPPSSFADQFALLKKAKSLKAEIGNFTGDEEYDRACNQLKELMDQYNSQVETVNSDFESVIEINAGFVYGSIFNRAVPVCLVAVIVLICIL